MAWNVEFTDEFERWWTELDDAVPDAIDVRGSRHGNMRELRVQAGGDPHRIFYAFDPRRTAILLIGASKAGDEQFYERMIPIADRLYDEHLKELDGEARTEEK
jgi:hypothetical protein